MTLSVVRQPKALGLGHAVLCAYPIVGDKPFAVMLPDDFIDDLHKAVAWQIWWHSIIIKASVFFGCGRSS
jgi:UTP-glucose-1-phosphate uridylyltransferase